jgi:hypothetical protein
MLKGNRKYYVVLAVIFIAIILLNYFQPKPVNWNRTYGKADKIPFGAYAIFNLLEGTYAESLQTNQQDLYNLNESTLSSGQTLLIVNDNIAFSELEVKSLFEFLKKGNTVLLCANEFSQALCDTFKLDLESNINSDASSLDSLLKKPAFEISYVQPKNNAQSTYSYSAVAAESYFSRIDTTVFTISAQNKKQKPVLLEAGIGKGKLLLSSLPDVFGNLFIVNHPNKHYTYTLLSKIKNRTLIWDEYYKTYGRPKESLFSFIFSSDALYMAYCLTVLALLTFMIFELKRRQRPVPIIIPLKNSTLEFVDVVSHVYFNSNNHKHIAEETIKYFYFDVSKKFHLRTAQLDDTFYNALHHLSGVDIDKIRTLFNYCETIKNAASLTQYDLLELNDRITNFKKQSMR